MHQTSGRTLVGRKSTLFLYPLANSWNFSKIEDFKKQYEKAGKERRFRWLSQNSAKSLLERQGRLSYPNHERLPVKDILM